MSKRNDDTSSLSHTKWNCQYHIVFYPKYRRKEIYVKLRKDIGSYLRRLCEYKGIEIVEAHAMSDHIHMLVKIPPKIAVSSFMGYLIGKSSLMIFENHVNLKYKYGEIIQFALQKIIQNKLQKLFNTNVIITFNKITKTKA